MKKEIETQRIRKRYLKEIVCQSRKWLVMAGIAMLILSIYNIVISWLLQTIIDIVSGDSSMTILQVGIIAMITFLRTPSLQKMEYFNFITNVTALMKKV